jgi:hypothetical protein
MGGNLKAKVNGALSRIKFPSFPHKKKKVSCAPYPCDMIYGSEEEQVGRPTQAYGTRQAFQSSP